MNADLLLFIGVTFEGYSIQLLEAEDVPCDFTGCTAHAQVRKTARGEDVVLDLQPVISDAVNGEVTIPEISDEDTAGLPPGGYRWDLVIEDADGNRRGPFVEGKFTIRRAVTR